MQEKSTQVLRPNFQRPKTHIRICAYTCTVYCSGRNSFRLLDDMKYMKGDDDYAKYICVINVQARQRIFWVISSSHITQAP